MINVIAATKSAILPGIVPMMMTVMAAMSRMSSATAAGKWATSPEIVLMMTSVMLSVISVARWATLPGIAGSLAARRIKAQ